MPSSPGYVRRPIAIPGVVEFQLVWTLANGTTAHNVLHAEKVGSGSIDVALCSAIMDQTISDARWTAYHPYLADSTLLEFVRVRNLDVVNSPQFESLTDEAAGTSSAGALPQEVAFCITLKTGVAGRSGRGRVYLPGIAKDAVDINGTALGGFRTAAIGFVQDFSDQLASLGYLLSVATYGHAAYTSPTTGGAVPELAPGHTRVVSITAADDKFDSQRRRK